MGDETGSGILAGVVRLRMAKIRKRAFGWVCRECGATKIATKRPKCSRCKVKMFPMLKTRARRVETCRRLVIQK